MGPIHIARDGRVLGRYAAEDVSAGLREGRFLPGDLAWHDALDGWVPLAQVGGLPAVEPAAPPVQPPSEPAWEHWRERGVLAALVETVTSVFGDPRRVFARLRAGGGYRLPLVFVLMMGTLTGWVALLYQYAVLRVNPGALGEALKDVPPGGIEVALVMVGAMLPVSVVVGAFLMAGLFHLVLALLSRKPVRYEATFRVYCYAWGVAAVLQLLPMCGAILFPLAGVYLSVVGLKEAQGVPSLVASVAVVLPVALCFAGLASVQLLALAGG